MEFYYKKIIHRELILEWVLLIVLYLHEMVLKVQSCKLYDKKCMIASTQITNTELFAFIAVLVFKLLSRQVLFINKEDKRNC